MHIFNRIFPPEEINPSRNYGLDFVRMIAIVFVIIAHASLIFRNLINVDTFLKFFGFLGVEIFSH